MKRYFAIAILFFASCKNKIITCKDRVVQLVDTIINADNRSDIKTVLSLYEENAVLMPPGEKPIAGLHAIDSNYQSLFSSSALSLSTEVEDVVVNGNDAVAYGVNTGSVLIKKDSTTKNVSSKYIMMLKRNKKNEWKITRLIWNDN